MRHKHELKSNVIRVFLSSSMKEPIDRELRGALKAFLDRFELYECRIVEAISAGQSMSDECREAVEWADVVILILEGDLRDGVTDEYYYALAKGKEVLSFFGTERSSDELESFVRDEVRVELNQSHGVVCPSYHNYVELMYLIEKSLLEHLASTYRGSLAKSAEDRRKKKGLNGAPGIKLRP